MPSGDAGTLQNKLELQKRQQKIFVLEAKKSSTANCKQQTQQDVSSMLNQKSAASAVIFILYILFCAQCYSIDAIPQTLAHGEGNINITFTTAQDAKESHDWIGIFPQNMCLDTHSCYFAYAPVAEVLPSRLWEVDSATLHIGLYEARYLKRPSYFSNHELVARKFFNITNSKCM